MPEQLLLTKLYISPLRPKIVLRPRLIERLKGGLQCKLTLISAPAGFGKTTLVGEWIACCGQPVAWVSLDEADNNTARFLTYLISALQTISVNIGKGVLAALQSTQPPSTESLLTALLNEIATLPENFILVLDDYHLIDSKQVDEAIIFLLDHLPPRMHLVITTREDPPLPLARLRARGELTELRAADLRFTPTEATDFLNRMMGLNLSGEDITALEARTEGWIAGLQLAALAMLTMQDQQDTASFINSFTGSHHFVMDYLIEEVLRQQPESIQTFLLRTSILDRLCGPLCDAVLGVPSASGQATLEYLQRANLFIVPLDDERRWYRYHHLFSELLRQRLNQSAALGTGEKGAVEIHIRASEWYENNKMILEAFQHAAAANDIERAERLMELKEMPLHLPGVPTTILKWLESLPVGVLNSKPGLWWKQAAMILSSEQIIGVEEKLRATEAALASKIPPHTEMDEWTRNLVGKIAVARALIEQTHYRIDTSMIQARRALEYLHPNNVAYRSTATQVLGFAHYIQGDRDAAESAYTESLSLAQSAGDTEGVLLATTRLGQIHETRNNQHMAADTYQRALQLIKGDQHPFASVPYLGLARISLEWNDLESAEKYAEQSFQLAKLCDQVIDRLILSELFLSRLKLIQGDSVGASFYLSQAEQNVRQKDFVVRLPDVAAVQALIHLYQGNTGAAAKIAQQNDVPLIQARVHIAQGDPSAALAVLEPYQQQADEKRLEDRRLRALVLQAVALHILGEKTQAMQVIAEVLALAEPGGFIRLFLENGSPMAQLLREAGAQGVMPNYTAKLLAAFEAEDRKSETKQGQKPAQLLNEPLSQRENEILKLIALGLSNREIGERLFLALDTVKGHNRRIFDKLQVQSRTEAIARARELEIL